MRNKKLGSALISALFIMTLVAIAATAMSTRLRLDIYRTSLNLNSDKLYLASQAVTWWAMEELSVKDAQFSALDAAGKVRQFPEKLEKIYPGIHTEGALYDMQAKFNLNNLQNPTFESVFYHLLENMPKQISDSKRKLIINATTHWINTYKPERGHDEYLNSYLKQTPPYYPGYQLMRNSSEFRLVSGVTPALYQALLPSITSLPSITGINILVASKSILKCLGNGLNEEQVDELLLARNAKEGPDTTKITQLVRTLNIPNEQITLESNYFLSVATTSIGDSHLTVNTIIKRIRNRQRYVLSIIGESLNTS